MRRVLGVLLATGVVAACGDGGSGSGGGSGGLGDQDPEHGAARLQQAEPEVDRAGDALGEALSDALGGTVEAGSTQYDVCSSAPVEGLSYYARWALRKPDARPSLDRVTEAATEAGWEVGETSDAEGFIPASVSVSRDDVEVRLSVDEDVLVWSATTDCIRVTPEEASERAGPAS
ncbi:hypothetical protein G7072_07195 [Nocardioides sp. HDW12B]|uniref:hypothetical protein n=1 Tax=Nocardioides sp. HDW12B TaxID=2714939 RepID=UPI00140AC590|nr:hypothetical protein [Nocardioides sp. HDW12B]QIK66156.1 hypothetical protein G7072_07195 [Nocardioides sp. HDW12B]